MKIGNIELKNNLILAPMAGYTNSCYRKIMLDYGAGLVCGEMISAKGLVYRNEKTFELTKVRDDEHPVSLQLFGHNIDEMVEAAKILDTKSNCDIIDINAGCSVKKVLKAESGAYLLYDIDYLESLVKEVVSNVKKPVTVKIRAGTDSKNINCVEVAKAIERAGASAIIIHGRLKSELFRGKNNLDYIKKVKEAVSIPVIGNGDVKTIDDFKRMIEYTKVDGVMLGRITLGNPWIFQTFQGINVSITRKERIEILLRHLNMLIELKGENIAILEMRSLASWYVKGLPNLKEFKQKLINVKTKDELLKIIELI